MLPGYCRKIADKYQIKVGDVKKLIPNLGNKTKYVLHYRNLQLYLSLGMKLTKIHRNLIGWRDIDFNTEKRKNAANDFEKDFLKLMISSVYGKTMENLWKRINARLINNAKDFIKYTSRPTYITHKIFGENYAAIHEITPELIVNNPLYVLFPVLELSKWMIHDFHYNYIKKNFSAELLSTHTDSLVYEIKSENIYEELFKQKDLFGFSNYSEDSKFFDRTNKKAIGNMKDEFGRVIATEFFGLKSKMNSIKKNKW